MTQMRTKNEERENKNHIDMKQKIKIVAVL